MSRLGGTLAALTLAGALAACATKQSVTLLPGEAGHPVGAVAVLNEDGSDRGTLAAPNLRAGLRGGAGTVHARTMSEDAVERRYGTLLDNLPPPAEHFTLTFEVGVARPSAAQEETLQAIFKAAGARPGAEVQVVGHTDRAGTTAFNDALSEQRAAQVRAYLISRGLPGGEVRATWRGEREPVVDTADGVPEPRNRRVEVIVR